MKKLNELINTSCYSLLANPTLVMGKYSLFKTSPPHTHTDVTILIIIIIALLYFTKRELFLYIPVKSTFCDTKMSMQQNLYNIIIPLFI